MNTTCRWRGSCRCHWTKEKNKSNFVIGSLLNNPKRKQYFLCRYETTIYGCHNKINKEEKQRKQASNLASFSSQLDAKKKKLELTSEEIYFIISKKQDNDYYKSDI